MDFDTYLATLSLAEVRLLRKVVEQRYVGLKIEDRQKQLRQNEEEIKQLLADMKVHRQCRRAIKLIHRMGYCITTQTLHLPGYSCVPVVITPRVQSPDTIRLWAGYRLQGKASRGPKQDNWANLYYQLEKEPTSHLRVIQSGGWEEWTRRGEEYYNEAGEKTYDMTDWPIEFPFILPE